MKKIAVMFVMLLITTAFANVSTVYGEGKSREFFILGEGWIIDENKCMHESYLELNGYIDNSNYVMASISSKSSLCSISFIVSGNVRLVFVGWDLSKVDKENPKVTQYNVGNRTIKRYDNAEEMYAALFSLHNDSYKCIIDMELFESKKGWIHGFFNINDRTYEIAMTIEKSNGIEIENFIDEKNSVNNFPSMYGLNVPYRSQWELLPDYYKASRSCGPASAAMIEEWYDGDHPNLLDIWNWRPADNGWWDTDLADYLNTHVDGPFFFLPMVHSDSLENCKTYCKNVIWGGSPIAIRIIGHSGDWHWVVMRGWTEGWPYNAFVINNPSIPYNVHLHYYGWPWWLYPDDRSFEEHAWKACGRSINVVW